MPRPGDTRVGARSAGSPGVALPRCARPRGRATVVGSRRALPARRDGAEEHIGLVEQGNVGFAPSVFFLIRPQQRVELIRCEEVAPSVRETSGRREETAHEHFGSEQRPDGVHRLRERVSVDHVEELRRVSHSFRTDAADPMVALEPVAIRGVQRPHKKALHERTAAVVRGRPSPCCRHDGGEVVVVDDETEAPRPQLDACPRCPLVSADCSGEDVDHAEVALDRGRGGRVDLRHVDGGTEIRRGREHDPVFAERGDDVLDVAQERRRRPDEEHGAGKVRPLGIEQVRGAVERDCCLACTGRPLDDRHARAGATNHDILLGLDRCDDVLHAAGPRRVERGHERTLADEVEPSLARGRDVEDFVL